MSVSTNNKVAIKDACILFDLIDLELLASFYELNLTVITTVQVLDEILDPIQLAKVMAYVECGKLQVDAFGQIDAISSILETNPGLGFTDASVIEVAVRRQAMILSSDKSLRNESARRHLTVSGLLWILEELYENGIISLLVTLEKLRLYQDVNKRSPKKEIEQLIAKLTQQPSTEYP